jgi:Sulfatase
MHLPTAPRAAFKGKSGNGEFADSLLELDTDFGELLDYLDKLGVADNTIVVFSGDNGPEEALLWRGTAGPFEGSYFGGSEGNLRTPCIVRYPGKVPAEKESNEIVHITDMYTTLVRWAGADIPKDRVVDGKDQRAFFEGKQEQSARDGFPYWMGPTATINSEGTTMNDQRMIRPQLLARLYPCWCALALLLSCATIQAQEPKSKSDKLQAKLFVPKSNTEVGRRILKNAPTDVPGFGQFMGFLEAAVEHKIKPVDFKPAVPDTVSAHRGLVFQTIGKTKLKLDLFAPKNKTKPDASHSWT